MTISELPFPVVGIGASAGGLEALEELFGNMPPDPGMAFVVVTHQHPDHVSMLPELLRRRAQMSVIDAEDGIRVEPNHVYVGPPGGHLTILNGTLHRIGRGEKEAPRLPIDYFFRSLAQDQKERAICIILSGTATDGTLGLQAIKGESGMAMVQEPQSARYSGMPSNAIATGLADYVLTPAKMAQQLIAYTAGPYLTRRVPQEMPIIAAEPLQKILALIRSGTGHDFSGYKGTTIRRRVERRMNVHAIQKGDDYVRYLADNPGEIDILFKELLIGVTSFFRDPAAWEALPPYLEELIMMRPDGSTLRAWVPGCSTGEEAFSLAMVVRECMGKMNRHLPVQIFGTDLDAEAIDFARAGRYPEGIGVDVSPQRLQRFFVREDNTYQVRKDVRELTIFAPHNVVKDAPFTRLDVLSCRNLLIYLNADLQKKLLPVFHYALRPGGLLFLGPSETIGSSSELFDSLDKHWKIYRRRKGVTALPHLFFHPIVPLEGAAPLRAAAPDAKELRIIPHIERMLLNRFAPVSIVVNHRGDISFIHGHTGTYLEPSPGEPRSNLLEMAREGLQVELSAAIRECLARGKEVTRENVRVKANGKFARVNISVSKIEDSESLRGLLLITLRVAPLARAVAKRGSGKQMQNRAGDEGRVKDLKQELQRIKESHQTALEELETSNEELQSTNEELQSTNEEMETSREEMQSLNEELTTVNTELRSKLEELAQTNNDMQNLLNSTDVATVFLDNDLRIKRFTSKATELVMLRSTDIGRPISDLTSNLEFDNLADECRAVLKTLISRQGEVHTSDGRWYVKRIMPYRTAENFIDGVVLTFVNIGQFRLSEEEILRARSSFEATVEIVRHPMIVLDGQLRVISANRAFYRVFHATAKQTEGELIYRLGSSQWDLPKLRRLLEDILPRNSKFEDYEVEIEIPKLGRRIFALNARRLEQPSGTGDLILLAMEDMTT